MASEGSLDEHAHTGSLFWLVTRSCNLKEANMDQETCQVEQTLKCTFTGPPALKKRKVAPLELGPSEMPGIPIIVNKKAIPAKTKLVVYMVPIKKR